MINYKKPSITVDIIIFNEKNNDDIRITKNKEFVLIKRKNEPFKDHWAIPGGFVDYGELVENAALREAKEETGIDVKIKKLFGVYSDPKRDPRGHTITIVYIANGNFSKMKADSDALDAQIISFNDIEDINLAFDHKKILCDVFNGLK
ncbi:ADP-ribose pyrophosphatase [Methanobrevibacter arboriphilus JCM 13429 = DSM 1125]|uniref:ADP-ribose pyrophosphatase n=1 Tax=Methanobrevibacter arboriphilus JCM 13429 = DSM 1125 TaxID=1300164 RepID=A0A1V6N4G7_METAZ|nr:NUDIX hydrolase [Methanobrevibacter arboriphilus]OQD59477.1 ADP-ribose pyrophosphatase [Methanobrevibacter arboriphilus JCM 13429 = DSM 1125]